jgi:hypothetical protein
MVLMRMAFCKHAWRVSFSARHSSSFKEMFKFMVEGKSTCKAKAVEHYEKFLSFWKDPEPIIPEVKDAKKRLAGLKSQIP